MDEADRATITRNLVELINQTNLEELLPKLLQRGVFTAAMCEKYRDGTTTLSERRRNLYLDLQRRGPHAFQQLLDSLLETGHLDLVRLLKPSLDIRQHFMEQEQLHPMPQLNLPGGDVDTLHPQLQNMVIQVEEFGSLRKTPLKVEVVPATQRRDVGTATSIGPQVYPMISKPRGLMLMINNVQFVNDIENARVGSEVDEENFESLFRQFGFVVEKYRDEGYEDMKRKIRNFAQRPEHRKYDCCVVAIMSHGNSGYSRQDSTIISADGIPLRVDWVLDQFTNINAQSLIRRPKIFFFQTCRGNDIDIGMRMTTGRIQTDGHSSMVVPSVSDTLICYSTLPGFKSNRDPKLGTWYIQTICEVFMKCAHALEIEDMLKLVNEKMEMLTTELGLKQMSMYENRGFRKLFFNPGLYDDGSQTAFT